MATVTAIANPSTLKVRLYCGKNELGKNIIKTKSFGHVKESASNQAIYDVANALVSLQKHDVEDIFRIDNSTLSE